jgi:uncharacterized membrane protein YraQ (UPF0718 family)
MVVCAPGRLDRHPHLFECGRNHPGSIRPHGERCGLGTVLAFMMSVVAISFPETVILRKVLKPRLILVFTGVVTVGIIIVGYLFNVLI